MSADHGDVMESFDRIWARLKEFAITYNAPGAYRTAAAREAVYRMVRQETSEDVPAEVPEFFYRELQSLAEQESGKARAIVGEVSFR